MDEYYIRTSEQEESRGPFNLSKLQTLADAGQVTKNTLYFDEATESWTPVAQNKELVTKIFPKVEGLKLRSDKGEAVEGSPMDSEKEAGGSVKVEDMLKAAKGDTKEHRQIRRSQQLFEKAVEVAPLALGIMLLFSAISFLLPHNSVIQETLGEKVYTGLLNYPFLLVGAFDILMAILLLLSVTDIYPLIRGRSMLGLGFGMYLGWALGDPLLMLAFGLGGAGAFLATIATNFSVMFIAIIIGIGGNGALAYLAISGRFAEFYSAVQFNLFG